MHIAPDCGIRVLLLAALIVFAPVVCAEWLSDQQEIMGTVVRVELWQDHPAKGQAAIAAVMEEMRRVDRTMSTYKENSAISRLNRQAALAPVAISRELSDLIAFSLKISDITAGAFDITYASVGHLYDYRRKVIPSEEALADALPAIDYHHVSLDRVQGTVRFLRPGVRIDLGGVAKGHAVDRSIALLQTRGIKQAIVTAGGDSRIIGDRKGRPWMVAIRDPRRRYKAVAVLPLHNAAISTSGDYERYFELNGERYHHIINPRNGHSVSGIRSVTVIGPNSTTADALSTGVFVLGVEKGLAVIESLPDVEAVMIDANSEMHYSSGLLQQQSAKTSRSSP
jgi:thiamine biosynthesis lipoprotein